MIGVKVWWVYLAPQNIPSAIVLTLGNEIVLYCILFFSLTLLNKFQNHCDSVREKQFIPALRRSVNLSPCIQHTILFGYYYLDTTEVILYQDTILSRYDRVQNLCESRGGRPGLPVLMSLMVSVDVKQRWTISELRSCVKVEVAVLGSPS